MSRTIKVPSYDLEIRAEDGDRLSDRLLAAGIPVSLYCNNRGLCGKCFVEVADGGLPPPGKKEAAWIRQKHLADNYRLACQFAITGDLEINVPAAFTVRPVPVLPEIPRSVVAPDPAVRLYEVELSRPEISSPRALLDQITDGLGIQDLRIAAGLLKKLPSVVDRGGSRVTVAVYLDREIVAVEPGSTLDLNLGLAVDVGTTTLVMDLLDLDSGKTLDTEAALNSQVRRGADVISRITYAYGDPRKAAELRDLLLGTLNEMIGRLLGRNQAPPGSVHEAVISGNTVMSHLLLGVPVDTLATAPYHAVFSRAPVISASEAGLAVNPGAPVYFSPNIMSFVGGDISAGLLASRMFGNDGHFLLVDLGTNGEIVLKAGRELITTSTAAGPAFEGMNISCGMPALPGAVFRARDNGTIEIWSVGGGAATGVCGTGLIDIAAIALARGDIASGGAIRNAEKTIKFAETLSLTQEDIRQLQLACAAVKSGVKIILAQSGLTTADLSGIYIAGAFGSYLNIPNSMALGLLPSIDPQKLVFIGNSSLAGARLLLQSKGERDRVEALVPGIRYLSLASDPGFQDQFIDALEFGPWT
jgi:uncharacterized 2Fe-2S/4Fe-4S cluster protein (DUF4445 family)